MGKRRFLLGLMFLLGAIGIAAQTPPAAPPGGPATQGVGLIRNEPGAYTGYTLISPLQSKSTFLIDMNGRVVKTWETDSTPSSLAYLLESGTSAACRPRAECALRRRPPAAAARCRSSTGTANWCGTSLFGTPHGNSASRFHPSAERQHPACS